MNIKYNLNIILELIDFKARRVSTFNKNLLELAEWEIKHAQVNFIVSMFSVKIDSLNNSHYLNKSNSFEI